MHTLRIFLTTVAFISSCFASFDPFTVTGITPEQSSILNDAASSLLNSITAEPQFTSIILEIATNSQAFAALTQLLAPLPTGTQGEAEFDSIIGELPPDAQSFFRSLTAEEGSILSSIIYSGETAGATSTTVPASVGAGPTTGTTISSKTLQTSPPALTQSTTNSPPASSSATPTQNAPASLPGLTQSTSQSSVTKSTSNALPASSSAAPTNNVPTTLGGSTLVTLTSTPPTASNISSTYSLPAVVTQNSGVLLQIGGLYFFLAFLGAGFAAL